VESGRTPRWVRSRTTALDMSPTWLSPWGKLPKKLPLRRTLAGLLMPTEGYRTTWVVTVPARTPPLRLGLPVVGALHVFDAQRGLADKPSSVRPAYRAGEACVARWSGGPWRSRRLRIPAGPCFRPADGPAPTAEGVPR
jgi:hypothetical protein